MSADLIEIGYSVGATLAIVAGFVIGLSKINKSKDEKLEAAKMETIQVLKSNRDAWKDKAEKTEEDYVSYRNTTHKKTEEDNHRMLILTEENGILKAKTDMTPVLAILEKLTEAVAKILDRLNV